MAVGRGSVAESRHSQPARPDIGLRYQLLDANSSPLTREDVHIAILARRVRKVMRTDTVRRSAAGNDARAWGGCASSRRCASLSYSTTPTFTASSGVSTPYCNAQGYVGN